MIFSNIFKCCFSLEVIVCCLRENVFYAYFPNVLLDLAAALAAIMSKDDEKELKRAIGLYASGIGIGSYVYLRRIFERIIVTASHKAISDGKIKAEDFGGARVNEKIKMLSDYLPKALVHNEAFYGIVSKGIHELSEEECIEYFPIMKSFIMMILRQWEKMRKDEEEEKQLSVALGSIAAKIKK